MSGLYVLIVVTFTPFNLSAKTTMHDFRGMDACEFAASAVTSMFKDSTRSTEIRTRCVPKYGEH
jgi:hypothetical protein